MLSSAASKRQGGGTACHRWHHEVTKTFVFALSVCYGDLGRPEDYTMDSYSQTTSTIGVRCPKYGLSRALRVHVMLSACSASILWPSFGTETVNHIHTHALSCRGEHWHITWGSGSLVLSAEVRQHFTFDAGFASYAKHHRCTRSSLACC